MNIIKQLGILLLFTWMILIASKRALHIFQQNRYEFYRYTEWLNHNLKRQLLTLALPILLLILALIFKNIELLLVLITCFGYGLYNYLDEKKQDYAKPLVYTGRVKRQIVIYLLLELLIYLFTIMLPLSFRALTILISPYLLIYPLALITKPIEEAIKKRYENEARKILASMPFLKKIGITGSFGKTSTKNIINDLLSEHYYTLMTPASYNTPMGITRTIREMLKPIHEVFVCEMGADHVGEITYLMKFVKPEIGVVTSIGPQHLNTFKSLDNIIFEKMQEIELLPKDGVGIINVDNKYIADYVIKNTCKIVRVGINNTDADIVGKDITFDKDGSHFVAVIDGVEYKYQTKLLGENNVMNALLAIASALTLGITVEETQRYLKEVRPVEHRLEKKNINGFLFIDNAFNSNPVSARESLEVLAKMEGKRILITPGLVDLGKMEFEANKEFGRQMIGKADEVILVGELEKAAILEGLKETGFNEANIHLVANTKEAFTYVYTHYSYQDAILIENDLPDAFLK